jgi:hypothetical protein
LSQRFWLAALEALRHSGLEQYLCRRRFRWSGVKKTPQHGHLRFLVRFAIDRKPPQVNGSIAQEKESRKKKEGEEDFMRNFLEENTRNKTARSSRQF